MKELRILLSEWRPFRSNSRWESLGIQYIASALRSAGHTVSVVVFEGESEKQTVDKICDLKPDVLGIPIYRETKDALFRIIEKTRERNPGITIITGGHTSTLYGAKVLKENPQIDVVVLGEGERTVVELCDRLKNGKGLDGCRGIFYRSNGFIFRNPDREPVEDLDILDHPSHDSIPAASDPRKATVFLTISSSRGCMGTCEFCVEHRVSKFPGRAQWRGRSAGNVVSEIFDVHKSFPEKRLVVNFIDGSIEDPDACNKKRLTEIIDAIEESGLRLAFSFLTRAESWTDSDEPLVMRMKRLGLYSASIGLESGSHEALRILGKRATLKDNARVCALFGKCGVSVHGFFIMFQPYTTISELEETANFLAIEKMAYRPEVWAHAVYIFPDTKLFRRITEDGLLLGTDESGYVYRYAYKDGRVGRIAKIMEEKKFASCKCQGNVENPIHEKDEHTID
jgi:anaerobic magnesium-protoporphyrin IX monomethyl ester cyclase